VEDLSQSNCDVNSFGRWQADYAAHGVATFPVDANKRPMVSQYNRFGLDGSGKIAGKFANAPAIGFMCGRRSGVTVLDVDTTDERVLADAVDRHGKTPIIARSGSGHFQAWYRHAGERRLIRPRRDVPIDILGAGFVIGPPSRVAKGGYQFIQGSLDDLASLPTLNDAPRLQPASDPLADLGRMREGDGRNDALFRLLGRAAHRCDDFEQLLDYATTKNDQLGEPMQDAELLKVAQSVWKMQCEGRNRFGQFGAYVPLNLVRKLAKSNPDALALYNVLKAENGPTSIFPIANAMAQTTVNYGWRRFAEARKIILEEGLVIKVSPDRRHQAALYRWPRGQGEGVR
jgi:Bifunctional DNA primase/polymerase, N-terminal/Primase C terminal 1 (PriCT-1)